MARSRLVASGVVALAAGLAALLSHARPAAAYCRTSVCNGQTASVCSPAQSADCGIPLFWSQPCISFSMQQDASGQVPLDVATNILRESFATWMNADCGNGQHPRLSIYDFGPVACNEHEYNQDQGNANIIMFRDDNWPYTGANATLALTTVTYNLDTGEIYDADMELNSAKTEFTTGDTGVKYDLLSITTHETGHFLGLAHSAFPDATMNKDYKESTIILRDLTTDDMQAICAAYPPGDIPKTCDATPRHGFQSKCATPVDNTTGCCAVAPGLPADDSGAVAFGAAVGMMLAIRSGRRRRRSRA